MEESLCEQLGKFFKPVDNAIKDEDLILYLDKQRPANSKFDRTLYQELKQRIEDRGLELTPKNFSLVYIEAYTLIVNKQQQISIELNAQDRMSQLLSQSTGSISKIDFQDVQIQTQENFSNYLKFEIQEDFLCTLREFGIGSQVCLIVPDLLIQQFKKCNACLLSSQGSLIDKKPFQIGGGNQQQQIKFVDGSELNFKFSSNWIDLQEGIRLISGKKSELYEYQIFLGQRRQHLAETFPELFSIETGKTQEGKKYCSYLLLACIILTGANFILAMLLNFARCLFIDMYVSLSFFGNIYIWRNFNLFLGLRLIVVYSISIIIDLAWEIFRLVNFSRKYEATMKTIRIQGLIWNFINILIKVILLYLYFKLTKQSQNECLFAIDNEQSVNEVHEDEYLMKQKPTNLRT